MWKKGKEYYIDFRMGYCSDCGKWTTIGNWKVRDKKKVTKDFWLCSKCGNKLENKINKKRLSTT